MKKLLFTPLLLCAAVFCFAQFPYDLVYEKTTIYAGAADTNVVAKGYIYNTSGKTITFTWTIAKPDGFMPAWQLSVADKNGTYNATTQPRQVTLADGDSSPLFLHLNPKLQAGKARVVVDVGDASDPFDFVESELTFEIWTLCACPVFIQANQMLLYPNPVNDILNLQLTVNEPLTVNIYNSLGQLQLTHLHTAGLSTINFDALKPGTYYIRYADASGTLITKPAIKL